MASEVKYRFALNEKGELADVTLLERASLAPNARFISIDFHQELIPRLGTKRRKHFGHKPQTEVLGSKETYLHALGKRVFREEYDECLRNDKPFYLEYTVERNCTRLKNTFGIDCRMDDEIGKFDLTKYFTVLKEEERDGQFIPDLLLLNPKNQEKIYIEIAVTHVSSEKKVGSKTRIIEYYLFEEDDIEQIRESKKGINSEYADLINFRQKRESGNFCKDECLHESFFYFLVTTTGKCKMMHDLTDKTIELERERNAPYRAWDTAEPAAMFESKSYYSQIEAGDIFRYFVAKAQKSGAKPKNCFLCKYHAENNSSYFDLENSTPIFCKFLKKRCASNQAASCEYYRINPELVKSYLNKVKS